MQKSSALSLCIIIMLNVWKISKLKESCKTKDTISYSVFNENICFNGLWIKSSLLIRLYPLSSIKGFRSSAYVQLKSKITQWMQKKIHSSWFSYIYLINMKRFFIYSRNDTYISLVNYFYSSPKQNHILPEAPKGPNFC